MQINCKQCNSVIPTENINLDNLIAKCSYCNSVFSVAEQFKDNENYKNFKRTNIPMPENIYVENYAGDLLIIRKWFSPKFIVLVLFCLIWNSAMALWFGIAITQKLWPMALFGCIHGAVGLVLTYYTIAGFINKTFIRVGMRGIEVFHSPLPWLGNKVIDTYNLKQLYCKQEIHYGKRSVSYTYDVHYMTNDNFEHKLLTGLDDPNQALYIEQEIERYLKIKDQPVAGEYIQ